MPDGFHWLAARDVVIEGGKYVAIGRDKVLSETCHLTFGTILTARFPPRSKTSSRSLLILGYKMPDLGLTRLREPITR